MRLRYLSNAIRKTMKTKSRDEIELSNWIAEYDWDVFGTLTFNKRQLHLTIKDALDESVQTALVDKRFRGLMGYEKIKEEIELNELKRYWNTLDNGYFGNDADRKNFRIQRFNLIHMGNIKGKQRKRGTHTHIHFAALSPTKNIDSFIHKLQLCWDKNSELSGLSEFRDVYDKNNLSNYLTHEFRNLGNDTIETNTTVLHTRQRYEEVTNGYTRHFRHK